MTFGRDVHLLVAALILANIGTRAAERFGQLYVTELGGSPADIGLLFSIAGLVVVLLSPVGGWLTDRYRRVTCLAVAPLIGAVGCLLMCLAPTWEWLIPGNILNMMPGLLVGPATFSLLSDLGPESQRGARFAYELAGLGVCAALGPLVGGFIYQRWDYPTFLLIQTGMLCLAAILRFSIRDPRDDLRRETGYHHPGLVAGLKTAVGSLVGSKPLRLFFLVAVLVGFGMMSVVNLTSVYMSDVLGVSEGTMGVLYSLAGVAGIVASLAGGVAADRLGRKPVMGLGVLGLGLSFIWLTGARSVLGLGAVWLVSGFMMNVFNPAVNAFMADLTDRENRGTVQSVFNSAQNLLLLPGPLLGGVLWEAVSPAAPFWFGGLLGALGAVIIFLYLQEPRLDRQTTTGAVLVPAGEGGGREEEAKT